MTFFVDLPLLQVIVFFATAVAPVNKIFAVVAIGAKVDVPFCVAVTAQFPDLIKLRVEPVSEQMPTEVVLNTTAPPLEAVAESARVLALTLVLAGGLNEIVWRFLVTSKICT